MCCLGEIMFVKNDSEFTCVNCLKKVEKLKYTSRDHCNHCLFSIHIDVFPGDRANECKGILKPTISSALTLYATFEFGEIIIPSFVLIFLHLIILFSFTFVSFILITISITYVIYFLCEFLTLF